jgi:hypothetical protein
MPASMLVEVIGGPLAVALLLGVGHWCRQIAHTLDQVKDAVIPEDGPSLRSTVAGHELRLTLLEHATGGPTR